MKNTRSRSCASKPNITHCHNLVNDWYFEAEDRIVPNKMHASAVALVLLTAAAESAAFQTSGLLVIRSPGAFRMSKFQSCSETLGGHKLFRSVSHI